MDLLVSLLSNPLRFGQSLNSPCDVAVLFARAGSAVWAWRSNVHFTAGGSEL